jgi:nicotinate-nucleotide adenylyltransferase
MRVAASSIGILGGTFDPVHNAHLAMARAALVNLALDKLVFIPTGTPRYRRAPVASGGDRVAMLRLALAGEPRYGIDERELAPQASAYTVDTLEALRKELPAGTMLYLLMGADQYAKLDSWHRPQDVRRLANIAVFARPGIVVDKEKDRMIAMPSLATSASAIRARAARGEDVSDEVPPAVASYIARHRLYS